MKIKRLEIHGFKSFADKAVLEFQQGITGVVGPNGCGKSNIVDALRWCMGEQSVKNLRGKAMEDVIFAGSDTRKPLGMAEVSLIFSTEDGLAPAKYLDYTEIQLTRRLYRNGDSEYLINKTPCRLLDITELFMDTGVGTRAYSVIEQGKIGMILHARPEERRFIIEEAAGVTKFKSRKQMALKKIEGTRQNLTRLTDILGEIRRQLGALQRQAKKAEKFREIRQELRDIELMFAVGDYQETRRQNREAEQALARLNERMREGFAAAALRESVAEEARLHLAEEEQQLSRAQENIFRIRSELTTAEHLREFQKKEHDQLTVRLERLTAEIADVGGKHAAGAEQQTVLLSRKTESVQQQDILASALHEAECTLATLADANEHSIKQVESRQQERYQALAEQTRLKGMCEDRERQLQELDERIRRIHGEVVQLQEAADRARAQGAALSGQLSTYRQERNKVAQNLEQLRHRDQDLNSQLSQWEERYHQTRDRQSRAQSRLTSLQELETRFSGYGAGVRALMNDSATRPLFGGVIADLLQVSPELEVALEAVLGEALQALLCAGDDEAVMALDALKQGNRGRAILAVPLSRSSIVPGPIPGAEPLVRLISCSGVYGTMLEQVLGPVLLVDGVRQALELARQHPERIFVTRAGEVVSGGCLLQGGAEAGVKGGIISQKREIRELTLQVQTIAAELASLEQERSVLREEMGRVSEGLKRTLSELHRLDLALAGCDKDRQRAEEEANRAEARRQQQDKERGNLAGKQAALTEELRRGRGLFEEISVTVLRHEQDTTTAQQLLAAGKQALEQARNRVSELRIHAATGKEQHETTLRLLEDLERQMRDLDVRRIRGQEELTTGTKEIEQLREAMGTSACQCEELVRQQGHAEEALAVARSGFEQQSARMAEAEALASASQQEKERIRQEQMELNTRFVTTGARMEVQERGLRERSQAPLEELLSRYGQNMADTGGSHSRRQELEQQLNELGDVNLTAIEEHAEMEQRFSFLSGQKDDLENSLQSLQQAIQKINRTSRQRFQETFALVNTTFQQVFPRLFCGGKAELRLTDEENLLESGIDIIVQPPGKKLQNVTLLSGGEKALTAVALIFSLFLIKPTPFCLLDEVDAPLDDANINRFNEMVREMSQRSQFIIITHNKATMQVADMLYGITMEEPGTSRLVSVRLN